MTLTKTLTAATAGAVLALSAGFASAATTTFESGSTTLVGNDDVLTNTALMGGGDSESIEFTATKNLILSNFLLTGNGFNSGADLMAVTFGYSRADGSDSGMFDLIRTASNGTNAIGLGELDGFSLAMNDVFSFTYDYTGEKNADVDMSFTTTESPAPIPVPAAGGLLLGALGLGGLVSRRKKKMDA